MGNSGLGQTTPTREAKHMNILHGINRLRKAEDSIESLLAVVMGTANEQPKTKGVCHSSEPSLVSTLNTAGDEITILADSIIDKIGSLKEQIL